jgi:DNA (cytosine-5)-methyltransferase 1
MKIIDLFSGCGGMTLGFQNAGHSICAAFDKWEPAIKIYKANFPNHPIFDCDLSDEKLDMSLLTQYEPEMVIGGPPCQDFSSAGKRDETLGRADLTIAFAKIVKS